ncbi:MAG: serine/threonine-protein kinase [Burkholderiales bacterium]
MPLDADHLRRLSTLLDQALDLAEPERETWLARLAGEDASLGPMLRDLLARHATKETADLLPPIPAAVASAAAGDAGAAEAGQAVGPYRLELPLGRGGMGEVWLASRLDGALKRKVALKLPHVTWVPGLADRFAREREILSGLEHPNIARLYDAGLDPRGRPYMALEYVEGMPIDAFCKARALSIAARIGLLLQVTDAVAFAHSRLVVHRDLKPGNMLVTADGQVRLLDFGIAKLLEGDTTRETALTQVAGRALTLDYASPEQIRGEPIGTASDVYSLGVVAFELLAGARPYRLKRGSAAELEEAIATADAPLASDVAEDAAAKKSLRGDLDAILNKALKKDAAQRYRTVDAFAQDLRRHLAGEGVAARPDTLAYRVVRFARRRKVPLAAGAVVVAVFVLAQGFGATAVVIAALLAGLGAALWQARRAGVERDRAYALADRNSAVNVFVDTLLTKASRAGPLTAQQLLEHSERLVEVEVKGNPDQHAFVLGMLAGAHSVSGSLIKARELLRRAGDIVAASSDDALRDSLAARLALIEGQLEDGDAAIASLDAIIARPGTAPEVRAEAHGHRAYLAELRNDPAGELHHAQEALRWYRASPRAPKRLEPVYLSALASAYHFDGQNDAAVRHFAAAVAAYEALGLADSGACVLHLSNWAHAEQELGDLPRALELFDRCVATHLRASPDTPLSPYISANRAYVLMQMGRWAEAEAGYRDALAVTRQRGMALIAYSIANLFVELYVEQGRVADAEAALIAAQDDRPPSIPAMGPTDSARLRAAACIAAARGDTAAAIAHAAELIGDGTPSPGVLVGLLERAGNYERAGEPERARADADAALALAKLLQGSRPWSFRTGHAHLIRARLAAAAGDADGARREAQAALPHLEYNLDGAHPALVQARQLAARDGGAGMAGVAKRPER